MVELVRSGRTPGELAREFEPSAEAIRNWVAQVDRDAGERTDGLSTEDGEELRRLRWENRRLREEREILAILVYFGPLKRLNTLQKKADEQLAELHDRSWCQSNLLNILASVRRKTRKLLILQGVTVYF